MNVYCHCSFSKLISPGPDGNKQLEPECGEFFHHVLNG